MAILHLYINACFTTITIELLSQSVLKRDWRRMKGSSSIEVGEASKGASPRKGVTRGLSVMDFVLRILAAVGTLGAALAMGTTNETLPFTTQFIKFRAEFDDLPSLVFFVMGNSVVSGYLVLSLVLSIFHILRSTAVKSRILLVAFDTVMMGLITASASAATSIVYIAHKGNAGANWFAICQQYNNFCERISGSLIGSYIAIALFTILIILSVLAISRN